MNISTRIINSTTRNKMNLNTNSSLRNRTDPNCDRNHHRNLSEANQGIHRRGLIYCIEPLPTKFEVLRKAVDSLDYKEKGFIVENVAILKQDDTILFPSTDIMDSAEILEKTEFTSCPKTDSRNCSEVHAFSLDSFERKFINSTGPIHHLSIDMERFDFDVLLGAHDTLKRVEFLELINESRSWEQERIQEAIRSLQNANFICYFSEQNRLWRITRCWMPSFDINHSSNLACVQPDIAETLAKSMEDLFLETLTG